MGKKTKKTKASILLVISTLIVMLLGITGCGKLSRGTNVDKLLDTEYKKTAYNFIKLYNDNNIDEIRNTNSDLKYMSNEEITELIKSNYNSDNLLILSDSNYKLSQVLDETPDSSIIHSVKFVFCLKSKADKSSEQSVVVQVNKNGNISFEKGSTNIIKDVKIMLPYEVNAVINNVALGNELRTKSDAENSKDTYIIPYLASNVEFVYNSETFGKLVSKVNIPTDTSDKNYGKADVKFALSDKDITDVLKASKTMFNEMFDNYSEGVTKDTDYEKYVDDGNKELTKVMQNSVNQALKNQGTYTSHKNTDMMVSILAASDKVEPAIYIYNASDEVVVNAKVQKTWLYKLINWDKSSNFYSSFRVKKDNSNKNGTGYVVTFLNTNGDNILNSCNNFVTDWR